MSNQASLFAEDTPDPYNPIAERSSPGANTLLLAGAAYQVPAFWMFCFDPSDVVEVDGEEDGIIPELVSEMTVARDRLAARATKAAQLFPAYGGAWKDFRRAIEAAERKYLKLDSCEIRMLCKDPDEFGRSIVAALNWFESGKRQDLEALLSLAGIEGYDYQGGGFAVAPDEDPERFLYGWLEDE